MTGGERDLNVGLLHRSRAGKGSETLSSVTNAIRLLKQFRDVDGELGVTELANMLGVGKSTAHRLITTLLGEGLLERNDTTGRYHLGVTVYELGLAVPAHRQFHAAARPVMDSLRVHTRESVYIAVLRGREHVVVDIADGDRYEEVRPAGSNRHWAHATAMGKVLLAFLPKSELEATLHGWQLPRVTYNTITDLPTLRRQLEHIRRVGHAINVGEALPGVAAVAAPIRSPNGSVIAALGVVGPEARLTPMKLRATVRVVSDGANVIANRLTQQGGRRGSAAGS